MDLNKLGQMLGLGYGDFLIKDAIFLTEKAKYFLRSRLGFNGDPILNLISRCAGKPHLRVRDFIQLPIPDYVIEIIFCNNDGIEWRWSFFDKDSDDSRMRCLKSVLGTEKVNLIEGSSQLYEFINRVCIEIHEIHTDLNDATHGSYLQFKLIVIGIMYLIFTISNH